MRNGLFSLLHCLNTVAIVVDSLLKIPAVKIGSWEQIKSSVRQIIAINTENKFSFFYFSGLVQKPSGESAPAGNTSTVIECE